jgi:DNA-binding response OmpR family regulator
MRVLIVEDEADLTDTLAAGLRADGFTVDVARDGAAGLERAQATSYEAIVLDIMLPMLSGYEVVRRLRAGEIWTPVVMLTAKDGEYDEADALDLGADDYITKPFSYVVLLAHLRSVIRRGAQKRLAELAVGDLVLDLVTRKCRRDCNEIELTRKEFAVLEYLMHRHDEVVPKSDILANVWDLFYVGYLRRKIDAPFARHSIETIRGAGYRLRDDARRPARA